MKKLILISLLTIFLISGIPMDRWLYELKPGEQFIYLDDNSRIRQLTFIDAVPNG